MKATFLTMSIVLMCLALPAKAQALSPGETMSLCFTGQLLCNKACGKGPTAMSCINTCTTSAKMCVSNGRWPDADSSPSDDEDEPRPSKPRSASRSNERSDGKCTTDAEFVHSWPDGDSKYRFNFKFRVSSDDCTKYGCSGYVRYLIHFNYPGGSSRKNTLVRYYIRAGQRSTEVTDNTYPFNVGTNIDIRDIEVREVSCSSP